MLEKAGVSMSWEVWKPEIGLIEDLRRFISELDQIAGSISRLAQNRQIFWRLIYGRELAPEHFSRRRSWEWDRSRSWVDACWSILFKQIDTKDSLGRKGSNLPPGACSSQFKWNREKRSWPPDNFIESEDLKNSYNVVKDVYFNFFVYFDQSRVIFSPIIFDQINLQTISKLN